MTLEDICTSLALKRIGRLALITGVLSEKVKKMKLKNNVQRDSIKQTGG